MAIGGMCSNESGIENSRMFIGAPPAFVRPGRESPGRIAIPSPFAPPSTGGKVADAKLRPGGQGRRGPASVDDDHVPIPESAQGLSAVGSSLSLGKISEPSADTCGDQSAAESFPATWGRQDPALQPFPADH